MHRMPFVQKLPKRQKVASQVNFSRERGIDKTAIYEARTAVLTPERKDDKISVKIFIRRTCNLTR